MAIESTIHNRTRVQAIDLVTAVTERLRGCLPSTDESIALHEPRFAGNEWAYVKECIDTGWVSSAGAYVDRFESELAAFTGVKRAVAVVNGTAALHVSLRLVGVQDGDEVLVPALTFVATANAVTYQGAVPHFVDVSHETLGLDPYKLAEYLAETAEVRDGLCVNVQTQRPIRAAVPMHTFGHPVDMDALMDVCDAYQIAVVEDAAESLGSYYKENHTGHVGRCAALSFNGNKTITTGGGGAILTNDEALADRAKHLTTTAKVPHRWAYRHDAAGYNYRMPNINAALGCAQLEQLPDFLCKKRLLAERYAEAFVDVEGAQFFQEPPFAKSNYWLNVLLLDRKYTGARDDILEATNAVGLMTRPAWDLMNEQPMYRNCPAMDLSTAEDLHRRIINIPSSPHLVDEL